MSRFLSTQVHEIDISNYGMRLVISDVIENTSFLDNIEALIASNKKFYLSYFLTSSLKLVLVPTNYMFGNGRLSSVTAEGIVFDGAAVWWLKFSVIRLNGTQLKTNTWMDSLFRDDEYDDECPDCGQGYNGDGYCPDCDYCYDCGELIWDCICDEYCWECGEYLWECTCERCPNCNNRDMWDGTHCDNCGHSEEDGGWGDEAPFACPRCSTTLRHYYDSEIDDEYLLCPDCGWGEDIYNFHCPDCGEYATWSDAEEEMYCEHCGWYAWDSGCCEICDGPLDMAGECENGCWGEGSCPECGINDGSFEGVRCWNCGYEQAIICGGCGAELEGIHCEECGKYFCHHCGAEMFKVTDTTYGCDGCCFGYCSIHDRWMGDYSEMCPECAKVTECPCCGSTDIYYSEEDAFSWCNVCDWDVREEYYECPDCGEPFCCGNEGEEHCIKCGWHHEDPEDSEEPEEEGPWCCDCDALLEQTDEDMYLCHECGYTFSTCPNCGNLTEDEDGWCHNCGCPDCYAPLKEAEGGEGTYEFCPECGWGLPE